MELLRILLAILTYDQVVNGYRILGVFPLQGKSHWIMQEELMKGLAKHGHQVDVITHFPLKKPIPNYTDISLEGSLPRVMNNVTASDIKGFGSFSIATLTYTAGTAICQLLDHPKMRELIENPPQDPPYDIVITEVLRCFRICVHVYSFLRVYDRKISIV